MSKSTLDSYSANCRTFHANMTIDPTIQTGNKQMLKYMSTWNGRLDTISVASRQ